MTLSPVQNATARFGVLVLAIVQLGAMSVVPVVDAVEEGREASTPIHVESEGSEDCPAHHDHLFCQVVRSLGSARAAPGADAAVPMQRLAVTTLVVVPGDREPSTGCVSSALGPRAPPTL